MLCPICNKVEVEEDAESCWICFMTGRFFRTVLLSDERSNILGRIRKLDHVVSADVWHFQGGSFQLGVILDDGRRLTLGSPAEMLGQQIVIPMIPPAESPWAIMVSRPPESEEEGKQWSEMPTVLPDLVDDEGLVQTIADIT